MKSIVSASWCCARCARALRDVGRDGVKCASRWRVRMALACCALPLSLHAQGFEGAITMRLTAGGRSGAAPQDVEYLSRGGNVRVNVMSPAGPMAMLGLAAEAKTYLVIESQKAYMEVPISDAAGSMAASAGPTNVSKSGRKEIIAGYECEHIIVETHGESGNKKTDMCLTSALGPYVNPMASLAGVGLAPWQQQLARSGGFPLKVTLPDGTVALEVTKIEKRRVSDALFRIPSDFSKMDMPKRP